MSARIVMVTGGSGAVGRILLDREPRAGWSYRVLDPVRLPEHLLDRADVSQIVGSVTDAEAVGRAMDGATDVVHLGALSVENTWESILEVNITGTRTVLEAAVRNGVGRFVFASSNHAVGFYAPRDAVGDLADASGALVDDAPARPDTYYGWSKAAGEELVRLYCERGAMRGVAVRIGHCFPEPLTGPRLPVWLSPRDAVALVDAALENDIAPFQIVWGVSANRRSWCSREGGRRIGFEPQDDSEIFAGRFPEHTTVDPTSPLGAHFVSVPLGEPMGVR
ncbi:NAD(P)-dependent oxidoreductase [Microbacterium soli]|uniref:NAD(P)-dependent oxidoreductase n=1 Tax=Microbacterium soli TaxID=446075 RepID=A0ABP7N4E0_9MICO